MKTKIKFKPLLLFSLALLFLNTNTFSQPDPNFYIFLCFGQSNMEGYPGTIQNQDKTVNSRFKVLEATDCSNLGRTKGKWYTAVPPLCRCYSGLTPADYFGKTLIENLPDSIKVGVVNVSVAGCKIELYDKTNYQSYAATAPDWMKSIINAYGGNPYGYLVDLAKLAQQDGIIKGVLLHQGESNTGENNWPTKVKAVYDTLMKDLGLSNDSIPLLAGEVVGADQGGQCADMNSIIAKLPQTIPNSYVISSKGCTDTTDNLHFNAAGYRELGKRYGAKMLSLLGYDSTTMYVKPRIEAIDGYALEQNYPNPFNPATSFTFTLPVKSFVTLKIFDSLGREITTLVSEEMHPGTYLRQWNAEGISSGTYFYRFEAGSFIETKKIVFIK